MKDNKHTVAIPSEVLSEAQTKVDDALALLSPYILALTPAERHELPKMGTKTLGFVEKAYEFAQKNPELAPSFLDLDAFSVDFKDAKGLWKLLNNVRQLEEGLDDTEMVAGSEAYQTALVYYKVAKVAAAQDIPGAKAVYEELKTRFPHRKHNSSKTETEIV
jgi:hypothetical protein